MNPAARRFRIHPLRLARDAVFLVLFCGLLFAGAKMMDNFTGAEDEQEVDRRPIRRKMVAEARAAFDHGDFDEAASRYREIAFEMPDHVWAWLRYGEALHCAERYDEAIQAFKTGTSFERGSGEAHLWLARSYARLDESDLAIQHLAKAIRVRFNPERYGNDFNGDFESLKDNPEFQRLHRQMPR